MPKAQEWLARPDTPFAALAALAAVTWELPMVSALNALAWGWLENQVLVGVKLVPLGQIAGQRLLLELSAEIPAVCDIALGMGDDEIGGTLPTLALASSLHETQYSRLFRS
jgi:urease accessory protein